MEALGSARIGETWVLRKRDGSTVTLVLGTRTGPWGAYHEWFYLTGKVYDLQDTVGLVRRVENV